MNKNVWRRLCRWAVGFWPQALVAGRQERLLGCLGAGIGLMVTEWVGRHALGAASPWFIAPMGASAVLLFAVPASPLAQPWSIIGGNAISALIGVACAQLLGDGGLAAAAAAALAIGVMFSLRCLHPPGGAVALTAVLGGPGVHALGFGFALYPVLVNSLSMAVLAIVFNNAARRRYPHHVPPPAQTHRTQDPPPTQRAGITRADLHAALAQGELLDVDEDDVQDVLSRAFQHAFERRYGQLRCADFMARDLVTVDADTPCAEAYRLLERHRIAALPVVTATGRLEGLVTLHDLIAAPLDTLPPLARSKAAVSQVMTTGVITAHEEDTIAALVPLFSDRGLHHVPVVNDEGILRGMMSQSDLVAALFHTRLRAVA
ncbi:HPP family protein [Chitiniphilus purpureus]|uniref:HPP family protein n=1 Tax=Chitiniphilus purpureus TaxID=2981137 RepID=A0ABY6DPQ9_9NEIS|nr:HPP family protein [Chitiniphilus sp. CD1]UXY15066.1 HPP family protein [Chitiniphilus sp. CD1]